MPETESRPGTPRAARRTITFEADGDLSAATLRSLADLTDSELGEALTDLVARLAQLDAASRPAARRAMERAIVGGSRDTGRIDVTDQIPRLVELYRSTATDPERQDVAAIAVRLLSMADRTAVLRPIPTDSGGLELRVRLGRALDAASGHAAAGRGPSGTRGLDDAHRSHPGQHAEPPDASAPPTPAMEPPGAAIPPPATAAPSAPGVGAAPAPAGETYRAYGVLDCDEIVLVGAPFALTVGLGERPSAGVSGPPMEMRVPLKPYALDIQLFADGFDVPHGESLRHTLQVSGDNRFPTVVVHLTPRDIPGQTADREISAAFMIDGEPLGTAQRNLRVSKDPAEIAGSAAPIGSASGTNIPAPTGEPKADVTIIIKRGLAPGSLMWSVESDLPGVRPTGSIPASDVGTEPVKFTKNLIGQIRERENDNSIFSFVEGVGGVVADEMPTEVIDAIRAASDAVKPARLQILILTDEPFVPWELAWLDPPLDPDLPAYLGAQANVGRWILNPKTRLDPTRAVDAGAMAVVSGVYEDMERLVAAEEEARELGKRYQAIPVDARLDPVMDLLRGTPPVDIIHFAVHGKFDAQGFDEGIYLVSGPPIVPLQIRTGKLKDRAPFVFLNACQLGSSAELLGDYYGTAQAFLRAGASAVIAPLWSVDDDIAQQIALGFYEQALAVSASPGDAPPLVADLLRAVRLGIVDNADKQSATYLAYQFYGHPSLRLSWAPAPKESDVVHG